MTPEEFRTVRKLDHVRLYVGATEHHGRVMAIDYDRCLAWVQVRLMSGELHTKVRHCNTLDRLDQRGRGEIGPRVFRFSRELMRKLARVER
jgi:hypothetical protein